MPETRPTVILHAVPDYEVDRIRRVIGADLDRLGLRPFGRTLLKPNVVASGKFFPHAHTRPEFVEGVLLALKERGEEMTELAVGERCGITVPTRFAFSEGGFVPMAKRVGAKLYHFEEEPQVEIPMYHQGRLRDSFYTPEPVAKADFFINCPKFKAHPWTTVTFSMKNYIGIQDDRHRLIDHDHMLNRKVADLQSIIQPQFIAIDGIIAGEGRMLTPIPFDLGMVITGNNQLAFDAVCCHIIGLDPMEVDHLRFAYERGFGPIHLDEIQIEGEISLEEAKAKAKGFRWGLIRVEDYFKGTNIRAYAGPPPGDEVDYCWGGCPGAIEEAIEILRIFDTATDQKMPPVHVVFGHYQGEIPAKEGEKIIFIGDCATFHGTIAGQQVEIESRYVDRSQKHPLEAVEQDIFGKMVHVTTDMFRHRKDQVIRLEGCPVSVAEQVLALVSVGGLKNPYLDPGTSIPFTSAYLSTRLHKAIRRLQGQVYNQPGPVARGAARPAQNLPPDGHPAPLEISSPPAAK